MKIRYPIKQILYFLVGLFLLATSAYGYSPDSHELDQGVKGRNRSIKAYVDKIGTTDIGTILLVNKDGRASTTYTFKTSETIPSNITLIVEHGAFLQFDNGVTLTQNGPFKHGLSKCFTWTGTGKITFGSGAVKEVYPVWWQNNTTPGTTDMTLAAQKALNTQMPFNWGVGRFYITDTLTFPDVAGTSIDYTGIISGSGMVETSTILDGTVIRGTVIVTPATFAKPLFYAVSSRNLYFKDFTVYGPGKAHADSIAFHFDLLNRYWKLENIAINNWQTGIQCGTAGGAQGNDSECMYDNVNFRSVTYCTRMYNSQAYNWHFYGCNFDTTTDYTCKVETAGAYQGSKIRIHGGFIGSTVKIFEVSGAYGMVSVEGAHFESGAGATEDPPTIFDAGTGTSAASLGCTLTGNEFSYGSCKDDTTIPFIQSFSAGPLVMIGNTISHPNPLINIQKSIILKGNYWLYEPRIYRSDALTAWPPAIEQGEFYAYYNGVGGDSVARVPQAVHFRYAGMTETYATAVPTTGSYRWGAKIWKTDVAAGGSPGWVCTESGTYSAATDNTGDTDGSTGVITGMTDTSDFFVGEYADVSAGFAGTGPYLIISKTATSLTLDTNSNAAQANITVNTSDPVWKALANIAA